MPHNEDRITCKFGGTSLAEAKHIRRVAEIIRSDPRRRFVVPSAPGKRHANDRKVTDLLYAWHHIYSQGLDPAEPRRLVKQRFEEIARELGVSLDLDAEFAAIEEQLKPGDSADFLVSRGEYLNGKILALFLNAQFVDPADYIFFNVLGQFDAASYEKLGKRLTQQDGLFVIPGFYGRDPRGEIKTFSRGGSDITGAIVARATHSALYENWTDVSGFRMADPRIVPDAIKIEEITYKELRELSYMGATVLHDEAIFPVRELGIPIEIRNTWRPEEPGTRIVSDRIATRPVCGIAGRAGFSMINIEKAFMNRELGFGLRVLAVLEELGIQWEHMPTGIDTMSVIIRDEELGPMGPVVVEAIRKRCEPDYITLTNGLAMIATVGLGMIHHVGVAAKLCTALAQAGINIRVIDQGSSEMNIIVGVEEKHLADAIRAIYQAFAQ